MFCLTCFSYIKWHNKQYTKKYPMMFDSFGIEEEIEYTFYKRFPPSVDYITPKG
jgi:hypothetical protein